MNRKTETEPLSGNLVRRSVPVCVTEAVALLLTFLLPLKFGSTIGVPELPSIYWFDALPILLITWPINLFPCFAALLLILTLLFVWSKELKLPAAFCYTLLWTTLAGISFLGFINASTLDFADQAVYHCLGLATYSASLWMLCANRREFARALLWSILLGALVSALSGVYQYFIGFEATRNYVYAESIRLGQELAEGQFKGRLMEGRVSADFAICNSYAGYLVMILPVIVYAFWKLGESYVEPPEISRFVLSIPVLLLFLFLLLETGSRGGLLAFIGAVCVMFLSLRMRWKWRMVSLLTLLLMLTGFYWMVQSGRGFLSMHFRFDYYLASLKMMLNDPFCGTGWGDFFHDYLRLKLLFNDEAPHAPHNFVLAFASQCGIPGFLGACAVLLLPVSAGIVVIRRKETNTPRLFLIALAFGITAWTLHSLMELTFETTASVATWIALATVFLSLDDFDVFSLPRFLREKRFFHPGILLLYTGTAFLTFWFAWKVIPAEMAYADLHESCDIRFARFDEQRKRTPPDIRMRLETAVRYAPDSPFPWAAAADYMLRNAYYQEAEQYLNEAIRRSPERAGFHFKKFRLLTLFPARAEEAAACLKRAQELSPQNPDYIPPFKD